MELKISKWRIRDVGRGTQRRNQPTGGGEWRPTHGWAHLKRADFGRSGTRYSVKWRIAAPGRAIALECTAAVANQEFVAEDDTGPTYWEGAVTYSGSAGGVGYLEMTGHEKAVKF